ncbi:MAG: DNA methyltransferase [Candidatus Firestonebacteria bacterium]
MYRSVIINLLGKNVDESKQIINSIIDKYNFQISNDGTIWIITENYLKNNCLIFSSFIIAENINNYKLRNVILVPNFKTKKEGVFFSNNIFEILFFSKNNHYYFNKDPIRERHIWKDVEWGKRAKNYHKLGKDPGNVWLKTEDDGKGNIIKHISVSFKESIERIIKSTTEENDRCLLININENFDNIFQGVEIDNVNA